MGLDFNKDLILVAISCAEEDLVLVAGAAAAATAAAGVAFFVVGGVAFLGAVVMISFFI